MKNVFLRLPKVKEVTGLSRSNIYLMIAEKRFPPPIKIGPRAVAWVDSEIDCWIQDRIKQHRK